LTGSAISAGGTVRLQADGAINLTAAQNTAELQGTNSGSSASIGIGINFGGSQNGISVNASASKSRGNADGTDLAWTNTHVSGDQVSIVSGGDTTLKGAVVQGNQVTADVKGNLNIESLQDSSTYNSRQQSAGVSVSGCVPPACFGASSVSASFSNAKASGDYASVVEQSGIQAGNGGFQVTVGGNTDLKGGVIASSEQAIQDGKNRLATATLTTSDIQNHDRHDASGISLGVTLSGALGDQSSKAARQNMNEADSKAVDNVKTGAGMMPGLGQVSGSQDSVTQSGISAGAIVIADEQGQQAATGKSGDQAVASLNRDVTAGQGTANALVKAWNGQKLMNDVQAQMVITSAALPRLANEIGNYARNKAAELRLQGNLEEAKKWDEGGVYRIAAHAALGAMGGGLSGAAGAGAAAAAAPTLNDWQSAMERQLKDAGLGDGAARSAAQLIAGSTAAVIGGAVGGGAGASTALNADANNRQLHPTEEKIIRDNAKRFAQQVYGTDDPTPAQLRAAVTMLANTAQNLVDYNFGYEVPYFTQAKDFLHQLQLDYAKTSPSLEIPGSGGQKLFYATTDEKNMPWLNSGTAELAKAGIIVKTPISSTGNIMSTGGNRDRLTGLPLDEKGRYTQMIAVNGTTFTPKYLPCATPECLGHNLDMSDPGTQQFVKAMDKKTFDDINQGATIATIANPVGAVGTVAGILGPLTSIASGIVEDQSTKALTKEAIQQVATQYLQKVYGLTEAIANSVTALVDLTGGWQAFVDRAQKELTKSV
jgi:filamentous hemagglutinin